MSDVQFESSCPYFNGTAKRDMYARIENLDTAMEAIKGKKEFIVQHKDGYVFIKYRGVFNSTFPDPEKAETEHERYLLKVRRECRGIAFDQTTKKIVTRKFHKFFNVNEKSETNVERINFKRKYICVEKLDGSLVSPLRVKSTNKLSYSTMLGFTQHTLLIDKFVASAKNQRSASSQIDYDTFCWYCLKRGWTPLFEYCSLETIIIIRYEEEQMILLGIRDTITGEYMPYEDMIRLAQIFKIPYAKALTTSLPKDGRELINTIRKMKNMEGYVIRFAEGDMYKIKTLFYNCANGINPKSIKERIIWKSILQDVVDDMIAVVDMDEAQRSAIQKFRDKIQIESMKRVEEVERVLEGAKQKKEPELSGFFDSENVHPYTANVVRRIILGKKAAKEFEKKTEESDIQPEEVVPARIHDGQDHVEAIAVAKESSPLEMLRGYLLNAIIMQSKEFTKEKERLHKYFCLDQQKLLAPFHFNPHTGILEIRDNDFDDFYYYAEQEKKKKKKKHVEEEEEDTSMMTFEEKVAASQIAFEQLMKEEERYVKKKAKKIAISVDINSDDDYAASKKKNSKKAKPKKGKKKH